MSSSRASRSTATLGSNRLRNQRANVEIRDRRRYIPGWSVKVLG
jgi:hypothetical protein